METGRGVDLHQILKDGCTEGSTYWFKAGNPEFLEILIKEKGATKEAPGESILKVSKPEVLPATGNSKYHCEIPPEQSKEGLKFLFERMKDSPKGTKMTLGSLITKGDAQEVLNQYLAAFCNPKTHVIETNIKIDFQDDGSKDEFFKALSKMVDEAFVKGASNPVLDNKAMEILQLGIHFGVGHKDPTVTNKRGGIFGSRHPQSPIRIGVVDPSVVATSSKEQYSQNQNTFPPDYTPKRTGILGFGRRH